MGSRPRVLVLDAMGVIYRAGDDVADLLLPFVARHGGKRDQVEAAYHDASLGRLSAAQFWHQVGLSPDLEDDYLAGHQLSAGLHDFLAAAKPRTDALWCLSNDLSQWSNKLRLLFDIEKYFDGVIISSEVAARKPDPAIYQALTRAAGRAPDELLLVDDRAKNLSAAADLGWHSLLFDPSGQAGGPGVSCLDQILERLTDDRAL